MECRGVLLYKRSKLCENYLMYINQNLLDNKEEMRTVSNQFSKEVYVGLLHRCALEDIACTMLDAEKDTFALNTTLGLDIGYLCCNMDKKKKYSLKDRVMELIGLR